MSKNKSRKLAIICRCSSKALTSVHKDVLRTFTKVLDSVKYVLDEWQIITLYLELEHIKKLILTKEQLEIVDAIKKGDNVIIVGNAATGKSVAINNALKSFNLADLFPVKYNQLHHSHPFFEFNFKRILKNNYEKKIYEYKHRNDPLCYVSYISNYSTIREIFSAKENLETLQSFHNTTLDLYEKQVKPKLVYHDMRGGGFTSMIESLCENDWQKTQFIGSTYNSLTDRQLEKLKQNNIQVFHLTHAFR